MAGPTRVVIPYAPRPLQRAIHAELGRTRFAVVVCHRRFGKTVLAINEIIRRAIQNERPRAEYAYLVDTYKHAKLIAWEFLKFYTAAIPGVEYNEAELWCRLPGPRTIRLLAADAYDSLRGIGLDGVVMDEYSYCPPAAWHRVIHACLIDRNGWVIFLGTPNGRNDFHAMYTRARNEPEAFAALYRASETGVLSGAQLAEMRHDMSPEEYAQEFECAFEGATPGAYYAREIEEARRGGRVRPLEWQQRIPVETAWDLGIDDATAIICFQRAGQEIHLVDYLEGSGEGLAYYAKELQRRPYVYGRHWLPPDAEARELGTGATRVEVLKRLGLKDIHIVAGLAVEDGIAAARMLFARCWFDEVKTSRLLDCLAAYRKDWDDKLQTFKTQPRHDWASHGADAFRYLAVAVRAARREDFHRAVTQQRARVDFDPLDYQHTRSRTGLTDW